MRFKDFLIAVTCILFVIGFKLYLDAQDFQPTQLTDERLYAMLGQCNVQVNLSREDIQKLVSENKNLKEELKSLKDTK